MPLVESSHPHEFSKLSGPTAGSPSYVVFYSNVVDGKMWCPDCRDVEGTVKAAFDGADKPKCVVVWVGSLQEWRSKDNFARAEWGINNVPTIIRLDDGKETARLTETGILDAAKWKAFLAGQ